MKLYKEILAKLDLDLEFLETEVKETLIKAEKGIKITRLLLKVLSDYVNDWRFKGQYIQLVMHNNDLL